MHAHICYEMCLLAVYQRTEFVTAISISMLLQQQPSLHLAASISSAGWCTCTSNQAAGIPSGAFPQQQLHRVYEETTNEGFTFIIATSLPNWVDISPVCLCLRVLLWVSIHLTGAGQKEAGTSALS